MIHSDLVLVISGLTISEVAIFSIVILLLLTIAVIFGSTPGIGPALFIALMIPILDIFPTQVALVILGGGYLAAVYGGSISAILLNVPGTGASACTTIDGFPMSKKGQAITAVSISTTSSIIGGLIGAFIVIVSVPILSSILLYVASPEYFLMILIGIVIIAVVSKGKLVKGLMAGFFGLVLTSIGIADTSGEVRYTFGSFYLFDGIQFIPVLIGIFAVSEMMILAGRGQHIADSPELTGSSIEGIKITLSHKLTLLRSALIGLVVGVIPGAGGTVANFVSYGITTSLREKAKDMIPFGEGNPEGVVASEGSNNAMVSGSLVPLLTFGIPGNSTTGVLFGALIFLGLRPGPTLFSQHLDSVYLLMFGVVIGCLFLVAIYFLAPSIGRITMVDKGILIPAVLSIALFGAFALRRSFGDVLTMFIFGFIGYIMVREKYSIIAFILGLILGTTAEATLWRSLQSGGWWIFVERPQSVTLLILLVLILVVAFTDVKRYVYNLIPLSR